MLEPDFDSIRVYAGMTPHAEAEAAVSRILVLAVMLALFAAPAVARSKAAEYLVAEQIAEACGGAAGQIDPGAVIERDLTGDGMADLVISHEGISCSGGGRSGFCGAQVCSVMIYVRRGGLLKLTGEMLGAGVTVSGGAIHMFAHGGKPGTVRWNGREFR